MAGEAPAVKRRVVIADAGPLIALARIDSLALLHSLFGQVCTSTAVLREILPPAAAFADRPALEHALEQRWIDVVGVPTGDCKPLNPGVDVGEASAIQLGCQWRDQGAAVLLVMDDRAGRLEARSHGLALIGTAALIGLARTQGLVAAARPLLEQLAQSGYFPGQAVIEAVLSDVGE